MDKMMEMCIILYKIYIFIIYKCFKIIHINIRTRKLINYQNVFLGGIVYRSTITWQCIINITIKYKIFILMPGI